MGGVDVEQVDGTQPRRRAGGTLDRQDAAHLGAGQVAGTQVLLVDRLQRGKMHRGLHARHGGHLFHAQHQVADGGEALGRRGFGRAAASAPDAGGDGVGQCRARHHVALGVVRHLQQQPGMRHRGAGAVFAERVLLSGGVAQDIGLAVRETVVPAAVAARLAAGVQVDEVLAYGDPAPVVCLGHANA
ncbi:hypothetical protein D3C72_1449040 [compost metagenome]